MPTSQPQPPQTPGPPSCSDCVTTVQPALDIAPVQTPSQMVRASDGKLRIDTPGISIIANPLAQHSIVLNHLTKQAQIIPLQPKPPLGAAAPGAPPMPGAPNPPAVQVEELGKSLIDGHPVEGKRYTLPAPALPAAALPGMPGTKPPSPLLAGMPGIPKPPAGAPGPPQAPKPPAPTVCEVWISTQFKTPVLTTGTTPTGVQTTKCKPAAAPEPDPSLFQIPPGYKLMP